MLGVGAEGTELGGNRGLRSLTPSARPHHVPQAARTSREVCATLGRGAGRREGASGISDSLCLSRQLQPLPVPQLRTQQARKDILPGRGLEVDPRQPPLPQGPCPSAGWGTHRPFPVTPPHPTGSEKCASKSWRRGLTVQKRPVQPESSPHLGAGRACGRGWLDGAGRGSGSPPPSTRVAEMGPVKGLGERCPQTARCGRPGEACRLFQTEPASREGSTQGPRVWALQDAVLLPTHTARHPRVPLGLGASCLPLRARQPLASPPSRKPSGWPLST